MRRVPPSGVSGQTQFQIMVAGTNKNAVAASVLVATTLAMALVCLIAAAGFVVVAHRRQRQLGLLAAIGATERHLRLVMLANGAIVGVSAAVVGGVLGVLGWIAAAPAVETAAAHRIDRLDLPWGLIAECMVLAVVMATAAAWWPARTIARLPVMAALSGRPARPRPVHRSLALALVLVAVGVGAITAAQPTGDHVRPLVLIAGIVAVVVGVVLASPGAVRALAAPAGRLPVRAPPRPARPGPLPGPGRRGTDRDHPGPRHLGHGRRHRQGQPVPERRGQPVGPAARHPRRRSADRARPGAESGRPGAARRGRGEGRDRARRSDDLHARRRDEPVDGERRERPGTRRPREPDQARLPRARLPLCRNPAAPAALRDRSGDH